MDNNTRAELCAACLEMEVQELKWDFIPKHCEFENRIGGVDMWIKGYLKSQGFFDLPVPGMHGDYLLEDTFNV